MNKDTKPLVPDLRFPEFRGDTEWRETTLDDFCEINPSEVQLPERFVYIDLESVDQGQLLSKNLIELQSAPSRAQRLVRTDDILYQTVRPYQRNNLYFTEDDEHAYVASTGYAQLRAKAVPQFLYQILYTDSFVENVLARCSGSNYPAVNSSGMKSLPIVVPIKESEQQKIADCLSSLDDLIKAEGEKLDGLRAHKKGLMQNLFPQDGETTPRRRFPEFEDAGEWDEKSLSKVADVLQGYGFPMAYQGQSNGDFPFCKVSDISSAVEGGGKTIGSAVNYVSDNVREKLGAKSIPIGSTIFAKIGEAIRLNRRAITTSPCIIDNNVAAIKRIKGETTDQFLFYTFLQIELADYSGGAVPSVNKTTLEVIRLLIPEIPEQQRIAECLSSLDDLITAQSDKIDALKLHKKGLMQGLFPKLDDRVR